VLSPSVLSEPDRGHEWVSRAAEERLLRPARPRRAATLDTCLVQDRRLHPWETKTGRRARSSRGDAEKADGRGRLSIDLAGPHTS
jgi:hypothetical protein